MELDQTALLEMERKLCVIADFIEDDEIQCEVIPANDEMDLPSLVVEMPDDDHGFPRILVINYVPLPDVGEYADFLQIFVQLPYDLSGIERGELLSAIDELNQQLPLGHCMTVKPRPDLIYANTIGIRHMYAYPNGQKIDDGCLLEALMLFMLSCDMVELRFLGAGES